MDYQVLNSLMKMMKGFTHEQIRSNGLNDTASMICSYIYSHENYSQDDVAKALCMDKTTLAKSVLALENEGILQRVPDEKDRRRKLLSLTRKGKSKCSKILNIHDEWLGKILDELNDSEQEQFESYCRRLIDAAKKIQEERN